jgi:hypothetical protein
VQRNGEVCQQETLFAEWNAPSKQAEILPELPDTPWKMPIG